MISRGCIICGERVESRYKQCFKATIEYAKSIDDFDDLVDPRTLALYYLGPVPSIYVLHTIEREKKKSKHFIFNKLRSTTLYSLAGTIRGLSSFVGTWSNTPLE